MTRQFIILTVCFSMKAFLLFGQENNIDKAVMDKFASRDLSTIQSLKELAKNISELSSDKKEQLQMLLLWSHQNMFADSIRFFQSGKPLTTMEAFKKRLALCDEFSNIFSDFCRVMKIPCLRIEGYIKYLNFKPGDKFTECNHAWNAVYIDSTWMLCDIFWATNALRINKYSTAQFIKKLNTKYFIAQPKTFIDTHLPCDPIFQFDNYPIKINAFTAFSDSIDLTMERLAYFNYKDSIKILMKLGTGDRSLRIAQHSYSYNKDNPNFLISEYYNYSVSIVNNKTSTKADLKKVKMYLNSAMSLIDQSDKQDIKALKDSCKKGLNIINRRLNAP